VTGKGLRSKLTCFHTLHTIVSDMVAKISAVSRKLVHVHSLWATDMAEVTPRSGRQMIKYDRLIKIKEVTTIRLHAKTFYL